MQKAARAGPAEAGRIYNPPRVVLVKSLAECNSVIQQIENLRYGALLLRELQFAGAGDHFDAVAGFELPKEELRGQRVQRSSAELKMLGKARKGISPCEVAADAAGWRQSKGCGHGASLKE